MNFSFMKGYGRINHAMDLFISVVGKERDSAVSKRILSGLGNQKTKEIPDTDVTIRNKAGYITLKHKWSNSWIELVLYGSYYKLSWGGQHEQVLLTKFEEMTQGQKGWDEVPWMQQAQ